MDKVVTSEVLVGADFNGHAVNDMDMDRVFQIAVKGCIGRGESPRWRISEIFGNFFTG